MTGSIDVSSERIALPPEIAALFDADPHRAGSVDAVLLDRQIPLTVQSQLSLAAWPGRPPYIQGSRPELEAFVRQALDGAMHDVQKIVALARFVARIPHQFPTVEHSTASGFYGDFSTLLLGGTEEEVIKKGSPLAAERARTLCAMAQVAGLPARVVFLARPDVRERHTVTEVFITGRWAVFDGFSNRYFAWPKHGYAGAWDVRQLPGIVDNQGDHGRSRYVDSAFYRYAGVAVYNIMDNASFAYPWDPTPPDLASRLRAGLGA